MQRQRAFTGILLCLKAVWKEGLPLVLVFICSCLLVLHYIFPDSVVVLITAVGLSFLHLLLLSGFNPYFRLVWIAGKRRPPPPAKFRSLLPLLLPPLDSDAAKFGLKLIWTVNKLYEACAAVCKASLVLTVFEDVNDYEIQFFTFCIFLKKKQQLLLPWYFVECKMFFKLCLIDSSLYYEVKSLNKRQTVQRFEKGPLLTTGGRGRVGGVCGWVWFQWDAMKYCCSFCRSPYLFVIA